MLTDAKAIIKLIKNSLPNIVFLDLSELQQQQFDYHPILYPSFHDETLLTKIVGIVILMKMEIK